MMIEGSAPIQLMKSKLEEPVWKEKKLCLIIFRNNSLYFQFHFLQKRTLRLQKNPSIFLFLALSISD
ncbi:hypothetical protein LEP1GSC079_4573 [Leptospira interrogans str. FPW1039]|uniref:Uncharacterized protein n=1 Tax=Leptospira interrogans str. FPW1039 TaxID=1193040 RepID=A0A0F6IA09_LEPIR|nr:hypothetical protein LEP1GSC079_4573 [Leptospira interrogans str. FPW1039]